jgi:GNAT superfamily N-acetyltransferase
MPAATVVGDGGAQVALRADRCAEQVVGWAEFVRFTAPAGTDADLAILVLDAWQRRGVGRTLIGALVPGAAAGGVRLLHADLDPANGAARGLLASVLGRDRLTARVVDGLLHYTVRLD